ncbi:hypothetical protein C8F04DRAFT_1174007 [Mycena alexandri]|uniref:Uncharacterized protein n=1 Tax=Mycena alexandri TaxID=1745969 RepID=A0AAD6TGY2_9AGAR|nr:hypothetical protein C8F04DRAFT_1174007 [Mycena alexandri]
MDASPSKFQAECQQLFGKLPYQFSPRIITPHEFPAGGFEFTGEDYLLNTALHTARLADDEKPVTRILEDISACIANTNPSVIPVTDEKTHIVGVLGPSDLADDDNEWMAADFALLHHAFGGVAASECWLTTQNLHTHVENRGDLLHGPVKHPRRVVLNKDTPPFYTIVTNVYEAFDEALRNAVKTATNGERLIVIMCAHGEQNGGAVRLGKLKFTRERMQGILCQAAVPTTVLTTACYSGLWAIPYRKHASSDSELVTTLAATTNHNPSSSIPASPSDRFRGGGFIEALTTMFENFAQPRPVVAEFAEDCSHSLPTVCRAGTVEKFIDLSTFDTTTAAEATSAKFKDFARTVMSQLTAQPSPSLYVAPSDKDSSVATIMGLREEVALLYRLAALRELPRQADYSAVPLGVEQMQGRVVAGSVDAQLSATVDKRAKYYWTYYLLLHPDRWEPRDMFIALACRKLQQGLLDRSAMQRLLSMLNARIELDDGANRLAEHLTSNKGQLDKPSIKSWITESYSQETMQDLGVFFSKGVQSRLSPGWTKALNSGAPYRRPACFLACVAHKHNYTVEELKPVVQRFFVPERRTSLPCSASLPNLGPKIDECIGNLTTSLSLVTLSSTAE